MEQEHNLTTTKQHQEIGLRTLLSQYLPTKAPKCAADILNSNTSSLVKMMHDDNVGEMKVKALLTLLISETLDFFSISNSMSDSQIAMTVNLILDDFSAYKPDFFIWVFDNAKKMKYGKNYNRIDGQIIFEWLNLGDADYTEQIEYQRQNEHKRIMFNNDEPKDKGVPMPENVKELMQSIGTKLPEKGDKIFLDPMQNLVNGFITDFDSLCNEDKALRFIVIDDKHLDIRQYVDYRILKHQELQRVELIARITMENPIAELDQIGGYEAVYNTSLSNGQIVQFYVENHDGRMQFLSKINAVDILQFLI